MSIENEQNESKEQDFDYDVVVVGGSVAGLATGLYTARNELETLCLTGGRTSLLRCHLLENYLGFPGGVDPGSFLELATDHAREEGCRIVADRVEEIDQLDDGFRLATAEGETIGARRVVGASGTENDYLEGFADGQLYRGPATHDNRNYHVPCDEAGRTDVTGFYVAGRLAGVEHQALVAAGDGARTGMAVVRDALCEEGYWDDLARRHHDWVVHDHRYEDWDFDSWFDDLLPPELDPDEESVEQLRERVRERVHGRTRTPEERETRLERGRELLADHLFDDE
ncbi:FAD-dependent oxidoreductase [Natribaculum luteum]|uniref:FAD-dependent oxidoreductase n=1 Tax=Natribaculum luteum TaxID=1586232 RepID=A0ABD5P6A4_9EURY|nr:FAD-dependent oxidoreductase [Natribaculum luteum]